MENSTESRGDPTSFLRPCYPIPKRPSSSHRSSSLAVTFVLNGVGLVVDAIQLSRESEEEQ